MTLYDYGARCYNPGASIFLNVDPLAEKYPNWNSYAYTYNNPINFVDPTGMEGEGWIRDAWDSFKSVIRGRNKYEKLEVIVGPIQPNFVTIPCIECHHTANIGDLNVEVNPYVNGGLNIASGILGAVGASVYVVGTEGIGAPLGGAVALNLSIGQIVLGGAQIVDTFQEGNNTNLQASGSIPGLIAREINFSNPEVIDAGASLLSTQLGNSGGVINAVKENVKNIKNQNQMIKNSYELYDTGKAVNDLINVENK
ncbi:RHS repeat-associated core domain-containing protein [Flavobacterium sp. JP2137]|uniref:RHS repeat-associated core domain-containing protein n=1 Tax=Flavobacterium sp. JP2137 TaxID=3414510 RepID=UPI003D2FF877